MIDTAIAIAFWAAFSVTALFVVILTIACAHALVQRISHASERRVAMHKHHMHRIEIEAARAAAELAHPGST